MNASQPQAASTIETAAVSPPLQPSNDLRVKSRRINGQELALLQQELQTGERTALGANESRELVEELRFMRQQLQRIRMTPNSQMQREIAHEALYGDRTMPVVLSVHSG